MHRFKQEAKNTRNILKDLARLLGEGEISCAEYHHIAAIHRHNLLTVELTEAVKEVGHRLERMMNDGVRTR